MARKVVVGMWLGAPSAAAVFVDGQIVAAARQEWIDRIPASNAFPSGALDAALDVAGVRPAEVCLAGYTGLPPAAGPIGQVRARLSATFGRLAAATPARATGVRAARVQTAVLPSPVVTHADVLRRWREARLPEIELVGIDISLLGADIAASGGGYPAILVGARLAKARLPEIFEDLGPTFGGQDAYRALAFAELERERVESAVAKAEQLVDEGFDVAIAGGRMSFGTGTDNTRCWMRRNGAGLAFAPLIAPDGVLACSAGEAVRAFLARKRAEPGGKFALIVGPYWAQPDRGTP